MFSPVVHSRVLDQKDSSIVVLSDGCGINGVWGTGHRVPFAGPSCHTSHGDGIASFIHTYHAYGSGVSRVPGTGCSKRVRDAPDSQSDRDFNRDDDRGTKIRRTNKQFNHELAKRILSTKDTIELYDLIATHVVELDQKHVT